MELKDQVTSVELSNKIHELGVIFPSMFYRDWTGAKEEEIQMWETPDYCPDNVNCFTVAELGEKLQDYSGNVEYDGKFKKWRIIYFESSYTTEIIGSEADARAKLLIYLLENKLLKAKT